MVILVKSIGMAVLALGIIFFLKPEKIKQWLRFWIAENHLYLGGLLNVLIGIVFLIAASRCEIPWVVVIFGLLSLGKGILLFILGREKITTFAEKYDKRPIKDLRGYSILAAILGILLIWSA